MITVVGLGPGAPGNLTLSAWRELQNPQSTIWLRTDKHPVSVFLREEGISVHSFDAIYDQASEFPEVYNHIAEKLVEQALAGKTIVYAVPGHPSVAEESVRELKRRASEHGVSIRVVPGMSSIEAVYAELEVDPSAGMAVFDALDQDMRVDPRVPVLFTQVYSRLVASDLKLRLLELYPPEHGVIVVTEAGSGHCKIRNLELYELDHLEFSHADMLFLPSTHETPRAGASLEELQRVMSQLRGLDGCPWDQEQSHESLRPYLIEEAYEVLEAIDNKDEHKLAEELGDLLLQIVFHCQIAAEKGHFTLTTPIKLIIQKMLRRHPHVFAGTSVADSTEVLRNWQHIKAVERGGDEGAHLDRVTQGLPALMEAYKVQARASEVGFDWPNIDGAWDKIHEELQELLEARDLSEQEAVFLELGDLLFAVVNVARFLKVEPETALRAATAKFKTRFGEVEQLAEKRSIDMHSVGIIELDKLWCEVKQKKVEDLAGKKSLINEVIEAPNIKKEV